MGNRPGLAALACVFACGGRVAGTTETEPSGPAADDGGSGTSSVGSGGDRAGMGGANAGGATAGTGGADAGGATAGQSGRIDAGSDLSVRTDAGPALFQATYPLPTPPPQTPLLSLSFQCLPSGLHLPAGPNGLPNCTVVVVRTPASQTPDAIADCQRCDLPGLEPFVPSIPLNEIGVGLSDPSCVCSVSPLAHSAMCPPEDSTTASWCYADAPTDGPTDVCASAGDGGIIGFSLGGVVGTLYVACFPLPSP
jgi:hypothetical protein